MNDEQRYTLNEAERELRRRECDRNGHLWDVKTALGGAVRIVCSRCGKSGKVVFDAP